MTAEFGGYAAVAAPPTTQPLAVMHEQWQVAFGETTWRVPSRIIESQ